MLRFLGKVVIVGDFVVVNHEVIDDGDDIVSQMVIVNIVVVGW